MSQNTIKLWNHNSDKGSVNEFTCSFCNSQHMNPVIDFGEVALAGGFLKPQQFDFERKFPFRV